MPDRDPDERFKIEGDPEDALRDLLKVDPDAPPAEPTADQPRPAAPLKDQGDPLSGQDA